MKNKSIITILLILFASFTHLSAKADHIIICREKVGGDKTNKFDDVDRTSSTAAGITTISIHCANPGSNTCPTASPKLPDDGDEIEETDLTPALINATEAIFSFIEEQFDSGVSSGSNGYTLDVTDSDGTIIHSYYITYTWELTTSDTEKATINIIEL
jgi:hypothetical protein